MAQVAKAFPSTVPQNIGVNRPTAYTRGAGKPSAPPFVPVEELNATLGVAAYGDASIFQEENRGDAEHDEAPPSFGEEGSFKAPSQLFANMMEESQVPGERRASGDSRGASSAIVTQAISAYQASARIGASVDHPRGDSINANH
ncbi:MAG: hypothetical protein QGI63_05600 [Rhodospirillales bacterium]|jgi:hypothetical protein|nr:hypothetical protein [Rhodospirillales bacterium]MDP6773727.1 hypothetical protein [Rhodospirillales bacterium]